MFFEHDSLENKINYLDRTIQELCCRNEELDQSISEWFQEIEATPEQIARFLSNPANFSAKNWQQLEELQKSCEKKVSCELSSIVDPRNNQKKYASIKKVQPHWLFIR